MKASVLFLAMFLSLAAAGHATTIQMQNPNFATIVIPDGSVVTSSYFEQPGNTFGGRWIVDFSFADGIGHEWDDYNDGAQGWIQFNQPVSNLSVNWITSGTFETFISRSCHTPVGCPTQGSLQVGTATIFQWSVYDGGWGGVASMTYDAPQQRLSSAQPVPEPSIISFMAISIAAVAALHLKSKKEKTK